jgi:DNA-binding CsgD family transcriptional regulator
VARETSGGGRLKADVNFASIMGLDARGGWHILRISPEGAVTGDTAAIKVLRQFFASDPEWTGWLPGPLADTFFESRDWGMSRELSRSWRRHECVRSGFKLTAHFIPDSNGGSVVLKTGPADIEGDASSLPLTGREREIVVLVAAGKTNAEIGILLQVSARTVQKHLENMFRKLGVETRMALAMRVTGLRIGDHA